MKSVINQKIKNTANISLIVSKMKDEACGMPIKDFLGLKSKILQSILFSRSYKRDEINRIQS